MKNKRSKIDTLRIIMIEYRQHQIFFEDSKTFDKLIRRLAQLY